LKNAGFTNVGLMKDGDICTSSSLDRDGCCLITKNAFNPTVEINLGGIFEVNTIRILIPDGVKMDSLEIRLSSESNLVKSDLCGIHKVDKTNGYAQVYCENKREVYHFHQ
jgi:hypothetical protein